MNPHPFILRNRPRACPPPFDDLPADWMAGGSCDPDAHRAYGFGEVEVVNAAAAAYQDTFNAAPPGTPREALRAALVGAFVDALEHLGA